MSDKKDCEHDYRYRWCDDGMERRFCAKCHHQQVRGFRKEDRGNWYDSLWAAFHFMPDCKNHDTWANTSIDLSEL